MAAIRSMQRKCGVHVRTLKGTPVFPETSAQNSQGFGKDNESAGNAQNLLAAPGAGFCWVITTLVVSSDAGNGIGVRVAFSGGLAALFPATADTSAQPPQTLVSAPFAMPANTAFGYTSTQLVAAGTHFSISGTAYKATVANVFNAQSAQVIGVPIDSDPAGDIG
jgi:hypothetical protein